MGCQSFNLWWLAEAPYWFKVVGFFCRKFCELIGRQKNKKIVHEVNMENIELNATKPKINVEHCVCLI